MERAGPHSSLALLLPDNQSHMVGHPMRRGGWYGELLWRIQEWLDRRWEVFD